MANTLLRLGLWTVIAVLGLYVLASAFPEGPFGRIPMWALAQGLIAGGVLVVAGVIFRILGKGAKVVVKNRCRICKTPIVPGAIYCRAHLRSILSDEHDKSRQTKVRQ